MNVFIADLFSFLNDPANNTIIMIIYIALGLLVLALNIILCLGYQGQYSLFKMCAAEIKSAGDIKGTRSRFLNSAARDYIKLGEKGVNKIDTSAIVRKHMVRFNLLGWAFPGIEDFALGVAQGLAPIGVLLAVVFEDYRFAYALAAAGVFVLIRLLFTIFDFKLVREKMGAEVIEYLEREVGQFYAGDLSANIHRLKTEISDAIKQQGETLGKNIDNMGGGFSEKMDGSLERWSHAVDKTAAAQEEITAALGHINSGAEAMARTGDSLERTMETSVRGLVQEIGRQAAVFTDKTSDIADIAQGFSKICGGQAEAYSSVSASINKQLDYIEQNQKTLTESLQKYELVIRQMAAQAGEGLGSIVSFHMEKAYGDLNGNLQSSLNKNAAIHGDLLARIQQLFEKMAEQSRLETQMIVQIKEQMDIHFERLKKSGDI